MVRWLFHSSFQPFNPSTKREPDNPPTWQPGILIKFTVLMDGLRDKGKRLNSYNPGQTVNRF